MRRHGALPTHNSASRTIAITRPVGKGDDTAEFVKSLGWTPFIFHTVELKPLEAGKIEQQIRNCRDLGTIDWIVFMSSTGAKLLFDNQGPSATVQEFLGDACLLAVGPRTHAAIASRVAKPVHLPSSYSSDGVYEFFSRSNSDNLHVVLIRSSSADDSLERSLTSLGIDVRTVNLYESIVPGNLQSAFDFLEGLSAGRFTAVLFTSAVSVSNFFKIAEKRLEVARVIELLKQANVGAIGPSTAKELVKRGIDPILPNEYLIEKAVSRLMSESPRGPLATTAR